MAGKEEQIATEAIAAVEPVFSRTHHIRAIIYKKSPTTEIVWPIQIEKKLGFRKIELELWFFPCKLSPR
jgi:hypothetical protein